MSKILFNYIYLLLLIILLFSLSLQQSEKNNGDSQIEIYTDSPPRPLGDPYDPDDEMNTINKNCNFTEYPEQAIRCNNETIICEDKERLHHCSCKPGYITFKDNENFTFCNYKQKKQLIAFLLEFCVGFGAGHFYRNDFVMASLKLVAFILGIVFICTFPITAKAVTDCDCDELAVILSIFYYLYLCGLAVWYIWDLVYFGTNRYLDYSYQEEIGEGITFEPW